MRLSCKSRRRLFCPKSCDMATTKIWDVRGWLGKVILYAENPEKTANPAWSAQEQQSLLDVMENAMSDARERGLLDVLEYATADYKTEQRHFVSGINCNVQIARQQMILTKKQWRKEGGIVAYHGYQSFKPNEVSPEQAHQIGKELAERLWGDRFEVIVSTHLNTKCIHNHFVINSVSFADGLRYYDNRETYSHMRRTSDDLCKKYRLSVIEDAAARSRHYAEWKAENEGQPTWRSAIREDVDKAVMASMSFQAFLRSLKDMGYEVKTGVKHMAVRPPGKERFVRLRSLGESYTEEAIRERILQQRAPMHPPRPEPSKVLRVRVYGDFRLSKVTWKGLRALYFFYLRKLRAAERQPQRKASYLLREDLRNLDALDAQSRFLFKHGIDTAEQLAAYRSAVDGQLQELYIERKALNNEQRRKDIPEGRRAEIRARIAALSAQAKPLRRNVKLCDAILERSLILKEKTALIKQMEQEEKQNVSIRRSSRTDRQYGHEYYG